VRSCRTPPRRDVCRRRRLPAHLRCRHLPLVPRHWRPRLLRPTTPRERARRRCRPRHPCSRRSSCSRRRHPSRWPLPSWSWSGCSRRSPWRGTWLLRPLQEGLRFLPPRPRRRRRLARSRQRSSQSPWTAQSPSSRPLHGDRRWRRCRRPAHHRPHRPPLTLPPPSLPRCARCWRGHRRLLQHHPGRPDLPATPQARQRRPRRRARLAHRARWLAPAPRSCPRSPMQLHRHPRRRPSRRGFQALQPHPERPIKPLDRDRHGKAVGSACKPESQAAEEGPQPRVGIDARRSGAGRSAVERSGSSGSSARLFAAGSLPHQAARWRSADRARIEHI
jgi:hypothetical protein